MTRGNQPSCLHPARKLAQPSLCIALMDSSSLLPQKPTRQPCPQHSAPSAQSLPWAHLGTWAWGSRQEQPSHVPVLGSCWIHLNPNPDPTRTPSEAPRKPCSQQEPLGSPRLPSAAFSQPHSHQDSAHPCCCSSPSLLPIHPISSSTTCLCRQLLLSAPVPSLLCLPPSVTLSGN